MEYKEMIEIVEEMLRDINKLSHKILKEFRGEYIHSFRVRVKKLRALLRLLNTEREMDKPLIPKLLKTFYGYAGIIRNLQMNRHNLLKFATDNAIDLPKHYLKTIEDEKKYWEMRASDLMADNNFKESREEIFKNLPDKPGKTTIRNFIEKESEKLKEQLRKTKNESAIHIVRKVLQDILYNWNYINQDIPKTILKVENLQQLTMQLEDFRDKCIQLEFLSDEYLVDRIKDKNEKNSLQHLKVQLLSEKQIMIGQLDHSITKMLEQL
jgi:CHAD domain-containing protein